ncbi:hypothetical protein E4U57_004679 [Claviceps arundinis]|uniref:BTB domain-containing protein n=1 Tax=Claviceps arundinis TaxID=1623583 RepID=A0ABQ7P8B0_9HYPO|nr:hypothetical protein E4U57_004679 [Claviceps arundinis]
MEASPYEGILKSPTFKFVVGEAKEELFLHSTLVASKSEVLGKMIKGPFIEGQLGYATLADEDVQTVAAFAEFIYTGDYKIKIREDTPQCDDGIPVLPSRRFEDNTKILKRPSNEHWRIFTRSMEYGGRGCATGFSWGIDTDCSNYFIAHAKISIFADCYGVAELLDLALNKLHRALCGFRLSRNRMNDILTLVRFCYERPGLEKLKRLVASYSAAIIDFRDDNVVAECLRNLVKERGDFAAALAWFMACRLSGHTEC